MNCEVKPALCCRPLDVGDTRGTGYLPNRAADWFSNWTLREKSVAVCRAERKWRFEEHFDIRHEMQNLEFALLFFGLALGQHFLTMPLFIPYRMVVYIWLQFMLEAYGLLFAFVLT